MGNQKGMFHLSWPKVYIVIKYLIVHHNSLILDISVSKVELVELVEALGYDMGVANYHVAMVHLYIQLMANKQRG